MKILLLADINSAHTIKWAKALASNGETVGIFSFTNIKHNWLKKYNIHVLNTKATSNKSNRLTTKFNYLAMLPEMKRAITLFNPDIVHAHYASSYGLLGALSHFRPFVLSVWGSDVMEFPKKSFIHRFILMHNLKKADVICATSNTVSRYLHPYTSKTPHLIPFGIDTTVFQPLAKIQEDNTFVITCAKAFEPMYNIDLLIKAVHQLKNRYPDRKLKLVLLGDGGLRRELELLVTDLHLENNVEFTGQVPSFVVARQIAQSDVVVNLSKNESFGVNILEAMACGKPVIVSQAEGFSEIVHQTQGNLIVDTSRLDEIVNALSHFMLHPDKAILAGQSGLALVERKYTLHQAVFNMRKIYSELLSNTDAVKHLFSQEGLPVLPV